MEDIEQGNLVGSGVKACLAALFLTLAFLLAELSALHLGLFGSGVRLFLVDSAFRTVFGAIGTAVLFRLQKDARGLYGKKSLRPHGGSCSPSCCILQPTLR